MKKNIRDYLFWDLDLFLLFILACFSAAFLIDSRTYTPTASLLPRVVSITTLLLLIGAVIQRCLQLFRTDKKSAVPHGRIVSTPTGGGLKWYFNLSAIFSYFLGIYLFGLIWASLLYLLLAPFLLGYKKFKIAAVIAVSWIIFFVFIFTKLLYLRIPGGIIGEFVQKF